MKVNVKNKVFGSAFKQLLSVFLLLPLCSVLSFGQDLSDDIATESALDQLIEILLKSTTLQADVEQLILDQDGRELQETQVRFLMRKPDHFYWAITAPYEEVTVTNGDKIWRYEADLDQVTIQSFENDPSFLPFLLFNGDEESLKAAYEVSSLQQPGDSYQRFVLSSLDPASLFERLSLSFMAGELEEMQIEDSSGQKTSLTFSNVEVNADIDPAVFDFAIPAGVDVLDTTVAVDQE